LRAVGANAELVGSLYEAFDSRDFDAANAMLAPDVVWTAPNPDWPAAGRYHGHDGVREFWKRMGVAFVEHDVEREPFVEAGDRVIVPARVRGRRRRKDVTLEGDVADIWTVHGGLVVAAEVYADREQITAIADAESRSD
jgi:uncharacterized protein